jgi:DNA replication protein DnaC
MTDHRADTLRAQCRELGLLGLHKRIDTLDDEELAVLARLVASEHEDRQRRGLERRTGKARLGRFKPMADFDYSWPRRIDREAIDDALGLGFIDEPANIVIHGPNGTGKTTLAKNIAHHALLAGHSVRFVTAADMLADLAAHDGPTVLARRLRTYVQPRLLCIDELGYLSYGNRYADLLFEVVSRRHESKPTLVTTNKPFSAWGDVFPNAACVVTLVDRLIHRCDVIDIDADSYRAKEALERKARAAAARSRKTPRKNAAPHPGGQMT